MSNFLPNAAKHYWKEKGEYRGRGRFGNVVMLVTGEVDHRALRGNMHMDTRKTEVTDLNHWVIYDLLRSLGHPQGQVMIDQIRCCLFSLHFLYNILAPITVDLHYCAAQASQMKL